MSLAMTAGAEYVVIYATSEAATRRDGFVDTEHLLHALFATINITQEIITELEVDRSKARRVLMAHFDQLEFNAPGEGQLPTPAFTQALKLAEEEARISGSKQLDTDHILIGLAKEPTGYAGRFLNNELGLYYDTIRETVIRVRKKLPV